MVRRAGAGTLVVVASVLALLAAGTSRATAATLPTIGSTPGGSTTSSSSVTADFVTIGPLKAHGGWTVTITDESCGGASYFFNVVFERGSSTDNIQHQYQSATAPRCTFSSSLGSGSLSASWGKLLGLDVHFVKPAKAKTLPLTTGCTGAPDVSRDGTVTGTIHIDLHSRDWGDLTFTHAPANVFAERAHCPDDDRAPANRTADPRRSVREILADRSAAERTAAGTSSEQSWSVFSAFHGSPFSLGAGSDANGAEPVVVIGAGAEEHPATGVTGGVDYTMEAPGVVHAAPTRAVINQHRGLSRGQLIFTPLPACLSTPHAFNATVTGTMTLLDPILGNVTLRGSDAAGATLALDEDEPGECNGEFYERPKPQIYDECAEQDFPCTATSGGTSVEFDDSTFVDKGQNTIRSESVSFGDGTSAALVPGGKVTHTYANPGTYTVTLTVTYVRVQVGATVQTVSGSSKVYISATSPFGAARPAALAHRPGTT